MTPIGPYKLLILQKCVKFEFLKIDPDSYLKTSCENFFHSIPCSFAQSSRILASFAFQILRIIPIRIAHLDFRILVGFPKNDLDFSLLAYLYGIWMA